jgi:simple sugar transport system ATP-binding protein
VLRLIRRLAASGVAIILITHRLQDLFRVCDRIAVMYEGLKVAERRVDETDLEDLVGLIVGEKAKQLKGDA